MHLRPNFGPLPFSHGKALQKERQIMLITLCTSVTVELAQAFFPLFLFNLGITHECLRCDSCWCDLHSDINTSKKLESIFTSHLHRGKSNVPHRGFSAPHHVYTFFFFFFFLEKPPHNRGCGNGSVKGNQQNKQFLLLHCCNYRLCM